MEQDRPDSEQLLTIGALAARLGLTQKRLRGAIRLVRPGWLSTSWMAKLVACKRRWDALRAR